jgi:hypothetical protein
MRMALQLLKFPGPDVAPVLADLAQLCTVVFRDWPHLYDGDGGYDPDHLQALAASPRSAVIMAYDGDMPVGAATCLPLEDAAASYQEPFRARTWPVDRCFYLAEAVLLPEYRGQGVGAAFLGSPYPSRFDLRFRLLLCHRSTCKPSGASVDLDATRSTLATAWLFAGSRFLRHDAMEGIGPE